MKVKGNGIKGFFGGFVIILIGISLLWFNESNNVKNIKAINKGRKVAIDIENSPVDIENNGKLVNINGPITILSGEIIDNEFNVAVETTKLIRKVEVYQWEEDEDEDDDGYVTYTYSKVWSSNLINSSSFNESSSHQNPTFFPYENVTKIASQVKIGDFEISEYQKNMFNANAEVTNFEDAIIPDGYMQEGKYITNVGESLEIGDVRISFLYNDSTEASIIGKQDDNMLASYRTESGKDINMLKSGIYSASEMLDAIEAQNNLLKWILRFVGYLLIVSGFAAIFKPIELLARFIPFLGGIVGMATGLLALLLGTAVAALTIAIAWLVFRPLLGVGLLIVSGSFIYLFIKYIKKKKPNTNVVEDTNVSQQQPQVNNVTPQASVQPTVTPVSNVTPQNNDLNQNNNNL